LKEQEGFSEILKATLARRMQSFFGTYTEYEERWGVLAYKTANIEKLGNGLFDEIISQENLELSILKVELLERGHS